MHENEPQKYIFVKEDEKKSCERFEIMHKRSASEILFKNNCSVLKKIIDKVNVKVKSGMESKLFKTPSMKMPSTFSKFRPSTANHSSFNISQKVKSPVNFV